MGEADRLNGLLDEVLSKLKPITRALFVGHFDDTGDTLEFRLDNPATVSYTHLRAHETVLDLVCRLLLEKKKTKLLT